MANTRHPKCAIRSMAVEAKKRLQSKAYGTGEIPAPAGISPAQRRIYIRLRELRESGEEVVQSHSATCGQRVHERIVP